MLTKLLKYDFLAQKRLLAPVLYSVLISGAATGLLTFLVAKIMAVGVDALILLYIPIIFVTLFCIISVMITAIYTYVHFYTNLFTVEGYLSHTLPVTATQHIASKFITSLAWQFIAVICAAVSLLTMYSLIFAAIDTNIWVELNHFLHAIITIFNLEFVSGIMPWVWSALMFISEIIAVMFMVYLAINIGSISAAKNKVTISIALILGLNIARGIVSQIIISSLQEVIKYNTFGVHKSHIVTLFINLIIAITCFLFTKNFMEKKLNI